jgi:hypothetical protein
MQEIIENCVRYIIKEEDNPVSIIRLPIYMKGKSNKMDEIGGHKHKNVQTKSRALPQ